MMKTLKSARLLAISAGLLLANNAQATDKDLLDALYQNGVLTKVQYENLVKKVESKEKEVAQAALSPEKAQALDWATRVKIGGDMRFRHENIDTESDRGVKESRQRIRARLTIDAQINDETKAGFRLVTAGGTTSSNQTLEGGFGGKDIFFDRAFLSWSPKFASGLTATFGKFKQPWYNVSSAGLVWDSDVNPEGVAMKYKRSVGPVKMAATGGYFILEDGDTVNGKDNNDGFSDDLNMFHAGLSASMKLNDMIKGSLGSNAYIYNNESALSSASNSALKDGDTPLEIYEVAGKVDIDTGFLPVYVYAQYAVNAAAADEDQDTAWLAGFGTKYGPFKMDYNYRDTQEDAVADSYNDSDFSAGSDSARGHKVKLAYKINKNFSLAGAYFAAEQYNNEDVDTCQLDLKAKF